jgi:hypothetical protein
MNFFIRQAPLFPLLALFAITQNPLLLFLIVLTKEQGLWVAGGYMLFTGIDIVMVIWFANAALLYIAVRLWIGEIEYSLDAPFFTPLFIWKNFRKQIRPAKFLLNLLAVVVIVFFALMKGVLGIQMILWTAALVCLFALWWEPQLWFPTFVILLAGGL